MYDSLILYVLTDSLKASKEVSSSCGKSMEKLEQIAAKWFVGRYCYFDPFSRRPNNAGPNRLSVCCNSTFPSKSYITKTFYEHLHNYIWQNSFSLFLTRKFAEIL